MRKHVLKLKKYLLVSEFFFTVQMILIYLIQYYIMLFCVDLYALDFNDHGNAAIEMGITDPHRFVLKPQREGGCNNKYGLDIKHFLESVKNKQERVAWILMNKIHPPIHKSYIIRPENNINIKPQELVSELGIFGIIIANENNVYVNKQAGHMLRTKLANSNEGGVVTGLGACDSPFLID